MLQARVSRSGKAETSGSVSALIRYRAFSATCRQTMPEVSF